MTAQLVPADSARRRARIALAIVLVGCVALSALAGYLHVFGSVLMVGLAGTILYLLPLLAKGMRLALHEQRYLTGTTVSGRRTVDLHRLVLVRRFVIPSRNRRFDFLLVELVDADGVRLVVSERTKNRDVQPVLETRLAGATRVSRGLSYLAGLLCYVPAALVALAAYAVI